MVERPHLPRQTEHRADSDEPADHGEVMVIGLAFLKLVVRAVDQSRGDLLLEEHKDRAHDRRADGREPDPHRNGQRVDRPVTSAGCAKRLRRVELIEIDLVKSKRDQGHCRHRECWAKVSKELAHPGQQIAAHYPLEGCGVGGLSRGIASSGK